MQTRRSLALFLVLAAWPLTMLADVELNTPQQIASAVQSQGAKAVVSELWTTGAWQAKLYPGVRNADEDWLKVASILRPAADAGATSELDDALSHALLKSPYRVLPLLRQHWWAQDTQTCVFGGDREVPGGVRTYVGQLEKALRAPPPKDLVSLRTRCLAGIASTKADLKKSGK